MATADDEDNDVYEEEEEERPRRSTRAKKRRPVEDDDETPIVSGRYFAALIIMVVATVLPNSKIGEAMEPPEPEATRVESWAVGSDGMVRITLVTADYALLGCAAEQTFDGAHCAYKSPTEAWPRDPSETYEDNNNRLNIIQPYRTWYDNKLVFVTGLWATPEVAFRLHQEPSAGILPEKLARFAVECQVKFIGKLENAKLRWTPQQNWVDPDGPPWVARAKTCKLIEEPQ